MKSQPRLIYYFITGSSSLIRFLVITVALLYQVKTVGLDALQLVLVGTTMEASVFVFEVPTGVVADLYSRRLSIIIGQLISGLGYVIQSLFPTFGAVLVGQVVWGLGRTFVSGALQAWIVDEIGEAHATQVFLRSSQIEQVSGIVGILTGVILGSVALSLPIIVGGALMIVTGVTLMAIMPETGFTPVPRTERNTWRQMWHTFNNGLTLVRGRAILMTMAGIGLLYGLYSEGYDRLWTPHLLNDFSIPGLGQVNDVVWFGGIRLIGLPLALIAVELARRYVRNAEQHVTTRLLMTVSGGMVIALMGFALVQDFLLAVVLMLIFGALRATTFPLFQAWINQHIESDVRATVLSMFGQIDAMGEIVGGPPIGWIGQTFGVRAALLGSSVLLSPVILLYMRALRQGKANTTVDSPA